MGGLTCEAIPPTPRALKQLFLQEILTGPSELWLVTMAGWALGWLGPSVLLLSWESELGDGSCKNGPGGLRDGSGTQSSCLVMAKAQIPLPPVSLLRLPQLDVPFPSPIELSFLFGTLNNLFCISLSQSWFLSYSSGSW